jgi:uncharacterized protein (TIGR02231 family)
MKKILSLLFLCVGSLNLWAQIPEKEVTTSIKEVKLHMNNALLTHERSLQLPAGKTRLIFTGLSPKLVASSVRLEGNSGLRTLSLTSNVNFLKEQVDSDVVKRTRDTLRLVQEQTSAYADELDAYRIEKEMLNRNQSMAGTQTGVTAAELTRMADLFRTRMLEINKKMSVLSRAITQEQEKMNRLNMQLNALNARTQPTSEIYALIDLPKATTVELDLSYVVSDCGWSPVYDIKTNGLSDKIDLLYRAMAYNNTGIDWVNVKLMLSTADPMQSARQPVMLPWRLSDAAMAQIQNNRYNEYQQMAAPSMPSAGYLNDAVNHDLNPTSGTTITGGTGSTIVMETVDVPEMSTDFPIEELYTIPADRKPYSIDIKSFTLDASFQHYAVPKMEKDVFLMASIVGWERLDLIAGPVYLYNEGRYQGESYLDTRNLEDTLKISLGIDQKVVLTRTKKDELNSRQVLGNYKKANLSWDINIRNNHTHPIQIIIFDQIPLSEDKEVTVSLNNDGGATLNAVTGELKWDLKLGASEKKTVNFSYQVKYPKNRTFDLGGQKRKMANPRFY